MSDCEYLGTLEKGLDGTVHFRRPVISPAPQRAPRQVEVPPSVARQIELGQAFAVRVLGDSMQPGILDNDTAIVSIRRPRTGDAVLVAAERPHYLYGEIAGSLCRYHDQRGRAFLTKDNANHRGQRAVRPEEILGVVTGVIPRPFRDESENHVRVQRAIAEFRDCKMGEPPEDLGFFPESNLDEFRAVFRIPDSELVGGRLPWGLFRASAIEDHPHAGIAIGDTLTVEPTLESHAGLLVVERNEERETIVGILQLEGRGTASTGEFYLDLANGRVAVTRDGGFPIWNTIAVVRRVERRGVIIPLVRMPCRSS
jgi:SOS-response transcriptional repressor LexA